jgi:hypothetical protein
MRSRASGAARPHNVNNGEPGIESCGGVISKGKLPDVPRAVKPFHSCRRKKSTEVSLVMSGAIPEADWRAFRSLHPIWIDRFCKRVNDELLQVLSDDSRDAHERYLAAYKLMHKRDKEIASAFNDFRRSTAIFQIAIIRKLGVITDEELRRFSESTRALLHHFWG